MPTKLKEGVYHEQKGNKAAKAKFESDLIVKAYEAAVKSDEEQRRACQDIHKIIEERDGIPVPRPSGIDPNYLEMIIKSVPFSYS